jgi:hypothetical protein
MFYLYKKRKKENLGIGEERILSFGAAHLLTLSRRRRLPLLLFPHRKKSETIFQCPPPSPHAKLVLFVMIAETDLFIFFHLQWPQLKCEKEEKSTGKRENKCVSGSRAAAAAAAGLGFF